MIEPRLLTARDAAAYLGFKSTEILGRIPVTPVSVSLDGRRTSPRYDRRALDAWLDQLSGLERPAPAAPASVEAEVAESEFAAWQARKAARG